jgi:transcription antitermination factor NusG
MSEKQEFWFAARTRKDQELVIRDALKKLNIVYFLPTKVIVRQLKYRKKKVEVPVIRNLIFVHATKEKACSIPNDYGVQLFYMKDLQTNGFLIIPEKQMHDFMFVMDIDPDGVSLNTDPLEIGEKVQVVKGEFMGIEGELVSVANRSYVIIRIPQVLSVSVCIPKSYLKKI